MVVIAQEEQYWRGPIHVLPTREKSVQDNLDYR